MKRFHWLDERNAIHESMHVSIYVTVHSHNLVSSNHFQCIPNVMLLNHRVYMVEHVTINSTVHTACARQGMREEFVNWTNVSDFKAYGFAFGYFRYLVSILFLTPCGQI